VPSTAAIVIPSLFVLLTMAFFWSLIFVALEGWSFLDALYFVTNSLGMIGYGNLHPATVLGKMIFATVIGFVSLPIYGAASYAIVHAMRLALLRRCRQLSNRHPCIRKVGQFMSISVDGAEEEEVAVGAFGSMRGDSSSFSAAPVVSSADRYESGGEEEKEAPGNGKYAAKVAASRERRRSLEHIYAHKRTLRDMYLGDGYRPRQSSLARGVEGARKVQSASLENLLIRGGNTMIDVDHGGKQHARGAPEEERGMSEMSLADDEEGGQGPMEGESDAPRGLTDRAADDDSDPQTSIPWGPLFWLQLRFFIVTVLVALPFTVVLMVVDCDIIGGCVSDFLSALWFVLTTLTCVGYGEEDEEVGVSFYPESGFAKVFSIIFTPLCVGFGIDCVTVFINYLGAMMLSPRQVTVFSMAWVGFFYCYSFVVMHFGEDWTFVDSLYFATATVTTIGYGDMVPTSDTVRMFAVPLLFGHYYMFLYCLTMGTAYGYFVQNEVLKIGGTRPQTSHAAEIDSPLILDSDRGLNGARPSVNG
jgi:voltage-gated potassium channel